MTITKPTLICTDMTGRDFAVTFDKDSSVNLNDGTYKVGRTLLIPGATRKAPPEGEASSEGRSRQGFVEVPKTQEQSLHVLGMKLERIMKAREQGWGKSRNGEGNTIECDACGKTEYAYGEGIAGLKKCTGCKRVGYCGKECQMAAWDSGHKLDCKVYQVLNSIWGTP